MSFDRNLWSDTFSRGNVPTFDCPRCGRATLKSDSKKLKVFEPKYSNDRHSHNDWEPEWIIERFVIVLECSTSKCGEIVIMSGDTSIEQVFDDDEDRWVYEQMLRPQAVFPGLPIIKLPEELPRSVRAPIKRAFRLFWSDLGASASRLRTSVERILDDFKIPATKADGSFATLDTRIKAFKQVDASQADTFDALRHVGNVGTHGQTLEREALLDAFEIYQDALEELYSKKKYKAKIEALKKKIIAAKGKYKP